MTWIGKNAHSLCKRGAWLLGSCVVLMMAAGVENLPAQSVDVEQLFAQPAGALPPEAYSFIGSWSRDGQSYSRGDCGFLVDQNGLPRNNCAVIVDDMAFFKDT